MKMRILIIALLALSLLVTACSDAPGAEPSAQDVETPERGAQEVEDLLPTKTATRTATVEESEMEEQLGPETGETGEQEPDAGSGEDAITPVEVDPDELTAEPPATTTVEQPEPGSLNPREKMTALSRIDLAEQLGVDVEVIEVVNVQEVEWRDSSLGCPSPGMNYLMVITPGFRVTLEAAGEEYVYHTNRDSIVKQCNGGEKPITE